MHRVTVAVAAGLEVCTPISEPLPHWLLQPFLVLKENLRADEHHHTGQAHPRALQPMREYLGLVTGEKIEVTDPRRMDANKPSSQPVPN